MKNRTILLSFAACVAIATLTACAGSGSTPSLKRTVVAGQARLDLVSDIAIFPLDAYRETKSLAHVNAENLAEKDCMTTAGHDWQTMHRTSLGSNDWRLFGLWNAPLAAQFGYDVPPDPEMDASRALNNDEFSNEKMTALKKCQISIKKLFPRPDPWAKNSAQRLGGEAFFRTMKDPEAKKLFTTWEKCMLTHGITTKINDSGVLTADVDTYPMPLEQQMQTAVNEVQCKTDNNIVQQLADIDASYQIVLIAKHQAVLNKELALNNKTDAAVAKYLATHG